MKSKILGLALFGLIALVSFTNFNVAPGKNQVSNASIVQLGTTAKAQVQECYYDFYGQGCAYWECYAWKDCRNCATVYSWTAWTFGNKCY